MLNRLKGILYDGVLLLACLGTRQKTSLKLLIVKTDEIGDYLLWRNFLQEIVSGERFKSYEIHFCGNSSWKSLFDTFDRSFIHQTIWLEKVRFKKDLAYRYTFLKNIYMQQYGIVINPIYSRDKRNDDSIVKAAKARQTIGMVGNPESVRSYETGYDLNLYTDLFDHKEKPIFEFRRNQLFTEFIIGNPSGITNTKIPGNLLPALHIALPEKYVVVFPGSRSRNRIWPTAHFIAVSNFLFQQYGFTMVVSGTGSDAEYTTAFCNQYTHPYINLSGKTSLPEILTLLKNAQCLLSVDTGSVHLAAAVGCTVFGIFNGSQYKRFAPYPKEMAPNFFAVYPDAAEKDFVNFEAVKEKYEFVIDTQYKDVPAEKMISTIQQNFNFN